MSGLDWPSAAFLCSSPTPQPVGLDFLIQSLKNCSENYASEFLLRRFDYLKANLHAAIKPPTCTSDV